MRDSRIYDVNRDKSVEGADHRRSPVAPPLVAAARSIFLSILRAWFERARRSAPDRRTGNTTRRSSTTSSPRAWRVRDLKGYVGTVDAASDQPRRRASLPVRGPLGGGHRLPGVVVHELRARSRPRDARHAAQRLRHARRTTRIVAYGSSWLERQDNVKTVARPRSAAPSSRASSVRAGTCACRTRSVSPLGRSRCHAKPSGTSSGKPGMRFWTGPRPSSSACRPARPRASRACSRSSRTTSAVTSPSQHLRRQPALALSR